MSNKFLSLNLWIIKKLLRMLLYLSLAMIVVYCYYRYELKDAVWIEFSDNNIRGQIHLPDVIAHSKDCSKLFEWQDSYLPKEIHIKCPWSNENKK